MNYPCLFWIKSDQWKYKESYEKFKLRVTLIRLILSVLLCTFVHVSRIYDILFFFLLVWFYCTLTIRESVLVVNGSKIERWWRLHHFLSTVSSAVLVLWSSTDSYQYFRQQNYYFNVYVSLVQVLLYYYQRGLLYRLRALGDSDVLQITIEGFHSWMLRGLSFLAPFLFLAYLFEFYNGYVLFQTIEHIVRRIEFGLAIDYEDSGNVFLHLFSGKYLDYVFSHSTKDSSTNIRHSMVTTSL